MNWIFLFRHSAHQTNLFLHVSLSERMIRDYYSYFPTTIILSRYWWGYSLQWCLEKSRVKHFIRCNETSVSALRDTPLTCRCDRVRECDDSLSLLYKYCTCSVSHCRWACVFFLDGCLHKAWLYLWMLSCRCFHYSSIRICSVPIEKSFSCFLFSTVFSFIFWNTVNWQVLSLSVSSMTAVFPPHTHPHLKPWRSPTSSQTHLKTQEQPSPTLVSVL